MRKECPEISWGDFSVLRTSARSVLGICYDWRNTSLIALLNFGKASVEVEFKPGRDHADVLVDVFNFARQRARKDGTHRLTLQPYAWHWFRVGEGDNVLNRHWLDLEPH